jgi:Domain of unknown function (DUF4389)
MSTTDSTSYPAPVIPYPAALSGRLDPTLSRWKWLVKWLLAIPHYVVLIGLGIAAIVVTVIAWFAILSTGRYPRSLFEFTVGVLRWNWRVSFYTYSALATDQYPPFTLARTDYPADFEVEYPAQLSRGLVLIKTWLLAIPHYLILGALIGGGWSLLGGVGSFASRSEAGIALSLLGALVLVAALILLFTGVYRAGLFALIMGINRWTYRVLSYSALLTDTYPPFRLDLGETENEGTAL